MADEQLRALERRWAATRLPEDEQALVQARVRAGRIDGATLTLAAALGSRSARRCLGGLAEVGLPDHPTRWLEAITARLGPDVALRGAVAALRHLLPLWEGRSERCARHGFRECAEVLCRPDPRVRHALERVEGDLVLSSPLPAEARVTLAGSLADCELAAWDAGSERSGGYDVDATLRHVARAAAWGVAALLAREGGQELRERHAQERRLGVAPYGGPRVFLRSAVPKHLRLEEELPWPELVGPFTQAAMEEALVCVRAHTREDAARRGIDGAYALAEAQRALRAAMGAALVPWLLGLGDPLAERAHGSTSTTSGAGPAATRTSV